ncbi:ABC transporter permease [Schaalia sp. lx-260]|uniref:ABC transporter permease n=1 Tax=Schaalia sp. lx-260 TaxID=2899082 RepID=UPI001E423AF5|nr:ABC transporter permease [Schaalia sp. lx-260]MCD4549619.1 ABC transporter permease [Schaalia sp. lx-260]
MALKQVMSRIAQSLVVLFILSFLVFSLAHLVPGDLVKTLVGNRKVTENVRAAITSQYHLDEPVFLQYLHWLGKAVRGDFGTSIRSQVPVMTLLYERTPLTLLLTMMAFAIALVIGIPLGIYAARRTGKAADRMIVGWAVVGISAPGFALGLILLYVFSVMLGWFPIYGIGESLLDTLWHLTLPALALAVGVCAMIIRVTRASVSYENTQDYVTFAHSRGCEPARIRSLIMKNAAIPIMTSAGLILGTLFGSTILVEQTFALPGLGQLLADSITFKDIPVVQAIVLLVAAVIVITTLLVDISVLIVDPSTSQRRTKL